MEWTHLLQIHSFHSLVHSLHYIHHTTRDLPHRYCGLYPTGDCIDTASQAQKVEALVLFADCILGVDLGDVVVALLDCLWEIPLSAFHHHRTAEFEI
mgnify:CR=1 FL=1